MKIILSAKEVKAAVAKYLDLEYGKIKIILRRKTTRTEEIGSILVETKEEDHGKDYTGRRK